MTAIDFPNNPTNGQEFSANGKTWIWNSSLQVWKGVTSSGGSGSIATSDTEPTNPSDGDLWFKPTEGFLYIYFNGSWVVASYGQLVENTSTDAVLAGQIFG